MKKNISRSLKSSDEEKEMKNQSEWRAKITLACYFALIGGIFVGSFILALLLFGMGIDYLDPPFPIALIATPVNETIILGVALLFARCMHACAQSQARYSSSSNQSPNL